MKWTDDAQAMASIATALTLLVALWAAWIAYRNAATTAKQAELYAGAQSATAWRQQILDLHDRGLTPGQIRYLMHLEDGGAGYEGWNGRLDDILRGLPPATQASNDRRASTPECHTMPATRDGCTGPCQEALRASGCLDFRAADR